MRLCTIYEIKGEYANMFIISASYWRIKNWLYDNGMTGYPWTNLSGDRKNLDDMTLDEYKSFDYDIRALRTVMAEVGDEPELLGGYSE